MKVLNLHGAYGVGCEGGEARPFERDPCDAAGPTPSALAPRWSAPAHRATAARCPRRLRAGCHAACPANTPPRAVARDHRNEGAPPVSQCARPTGRLAARRAGPSKQAAAPPSRRGPDAIRPFGGTRTSRCGSTSRLPWPQAITSPKESDVPFDDVSSGASSAKSPPDAPRRLVDRRILARSPPTASSGPGASASASAAACCPAHHRPPRQPWCPARRHRLSPCRCHPAGIPLPP